MNNQQDHHTCQEEQEPVEAKTGAPVDSSRRKFAMSGVASAVLLSLPSRSVLASGGGCGGCQSPSGFQSGNLSQHGKPKYCSGRTPGYWGTHGGTPNRYKNYYPGDWKGTGFDPGKWVLCSSSIKTACCGSTSNTCGYWAGGTKFSDVFQCSGHGSIYSGKTLMQVIWGNGGADPYQLGAHIASALLNAAKGLTPPLSVQDVKDIFNEWNRTGGYVPSAGLKPWDAAQIVTYLKTTMPI